MDTTARQDHWRRNVRLKAGLLAIWFVVSYGFGILLVEQLNEVSLGDFQLGFWFAQQGSIYVFVVLIGFYAWRMDALDRQLGADDNGDGAGPRVIDLGGGVDPSRTGAGRPPEAAGDGDGADTSSGRDEEGRS
jgi:putative solute:sodium symporter small subunit